MIENNEIGKMISQAVADAVAPLYERLEALHKEQKSENAEKEKINWESITLNRFGEDYKIY